VTLITFLHRFPPFPCSGRPSRNTDALFHTRTCDIQMSRCAICLLLAQLLLRRSLSDKRRQRWASGRHADRWFPTAMMIISTSRNNLLGVDLPLSESVRQRCYCWGSLRESRTSSINSANKKTLYFHDDNKERRRKTRKEGVEQS
jgi:hypothetical protein